MSPPQEVSPVLSSMYCPKQGLCPPWGVAEPRDLVPQDGSESSLGGTPVLQALRADPAVCTASPPLGGTRRLRGTGGPVGTGGATVQGEGDERPRPDTVK